MLIDGCSLDAAIWNAIGGRGAGHNGPPGPELRLLFGLGAASAESWISDNKFLETKDLDAVKTRLGVPDDLAACHTAEDAVRVLNYITIDQSGRRTSRQSSGPSMRFRCPQSC